MKKILILFSLVFILYGCGSGKEGDASKYNINDSNIENVTSPSQDYILAALNSIDSIDNIKAVTEDNDPNGKLNKNGEYYSAVFFTSNLVEYDKSKDAIDNGTDGGGCVESYSSEEDAIARDKYLGKYKSSGGHVRLGTVVVRTSAKLDEETRLHLEDNICNALLSGNDFPPYIENPMENSVTNYDEKYNLDRIDNNSNDNFSKQERLITKFVNEVNNVCDSKIIKVDFMNNHTKASLKFDNDQWYTVWSQANDDSEKPDFMVEVGFNNGKETVNNYDDVISAILKVFASNYDNENIDSIIAEAKSNGNYIDDLISITYKYSASPAGWQSGDHYWINIDCYDYKYPTD